MTTTNTNTSTTSTSKAKPPMHVRFAEETHRLADRLADPDESKTGFRRKIGWKLPYWISNEADTELRAKLERADKLRKETSVSLDALATILDELPEDYSERARGGGGGKAEIEKGSTVRFKADKVDTYVGLMFDPEAPERPLTGDEIRAIEWTVLAVRRSKLSVRDPKSGAQFLPSKSDFELVDGEDA